MGIKLFRHFKQRVGQSRRGVRMISVNRLDLAGKQDEFGQFITVGLMIPIQNKIDERIDFMTS